MLPGPLWRSEKGRVILHTTQRPQENHFPNLPGLYLTTFEALSLFLRQFALGFSSDSNTQVACFAPRAGMVVLAPLHAPHLVLRWDPPQRWPWTDVGLVTVVARGGNGCLTSPFAPPLSGTVFCPELGSAFVE